jgi:hypothetical protein
VRPTTCRVPDLQATLPASLLSRPDIYVHFRDLPAPWRSLLPLELSYLALETAGNTLYGNSPWPQKSAPCLSKARATSRLLRFTPIDEKHDAKETIESYAADLEGEGYEAERKRLMEKAEAVELTPVEAFKWNVDGDQSPCKSTASQSRCMHLRLIG